MEPEIQASPLLTWIRQNKIATLTPTRGLPSLVEEVAAARVHGSWWKHPAAHAIYAAYVEMQASDEVLTTKLVATKITFVHARLWPLLLAIVTDEAWVQAAAHDLHEDAAALFALVQMRDTVNTNDLAALWARGARALKQARVALERRGLVISRESHTARGRHTVMLESWQSFRQRSATRPLAVPSFALALAELKHHVPHAHLSIEPRP